MPGRQYTRHVTPASVPSSRDAFVSVDRSRRSRDARRVQDDTSRFSLVVECRYLSDHKVGLSLLSGCLSELERLERTGGREGGKGAGRMSLLRSFDLTHPSTFAALALYHTTTGTSKAST